jgi:RsiW-degrading membrane proteinase PrsW (M82 family)
MQNYRSAFVMGAVSIPFVFVIELLVLAGFAALRQTSSVLVLLIAIAFVEEVGKSIFVYAAFEANRFERTSRIALILGTLSGFGFFVSEKFTVIVQSVGLTDLQLGQAAFSTLLPSLSAADTVLGLVVIGLWPFLHSITAAISAYGASKSRRYYIIAVVIATVVHVLYNYSAVIAYA